MRIASIFIIITTPIILIFSNLLFLVFNEGFYNKLYETSGVYQHTEKTQVRLETENLMSYFQDKGESDQNLFSEQAVLHLADVKEIFNKIKAASLSATILFTFSLLYLIYKNRLRQIKKLLIVGSVTTLLVLITSFAILVTNFTSAFIMMHKIIFQNNLWLFPENDNLIKLFPEHFFVGFAKQLIINIFISASLLIILAQLIQTKDDSARL